MHCKKQGELVFYNMIWTGELLNAHSRWQGGLVCSSNSSSICRLQNVGKVCLSSVALVCLLLLFECHKISIFSPYASSCTLPPSGFDNWNLLKTLIPPWNKGWKLKLNTRFTLAWLSQLSEPKLSTSAQWMSYACVRRHLSTSFFFLILYFCPLLNVRAVITHAKGWET